MTNLSVVKVGRGLPLVFVCLVCQEGVWSAMYQARAGGAGEYDNQMYMVATGRCENNVRGSVECY